MASFNKDKFVLYVAWIMASVWMLVCISAGVLGVIWLWKHV